MYTIRECYTKWERILIENRMKDIIMDRLSLSTGTGVLWIFEIS